MIHANFIISSPRCHCKSFRALTVMYWNSFEYLCILTFSLITYYYLLTTLTLITYYLFYSYYFLFHYEKTYSKHELHASFSRQSKDIFTRNKACTERHTDRQTDCINIFHLKKLKI